MNVTLRSILGNPKMHVDKIFCFLTNTLAVIKARPVPIATRLAAASSSVGILLEHNLS